MSSPRCKRLEGQAKVDAGFGCLASFLLTADADNWQLTTGPLSNVDTTLPILPQGPLLGGHQLSGMPRANFLWMQSTRDRMFPDDCRCFPYGLHTHPAFIYEGYSWKYHAFTPGRRHHCRSIGLAGTRALDSNDQNSREICFFLAPAQFVKYCITPREKYLLGNPFRSSLIRSYFRPGGRKYSRDSLASELLISGAGQREQRHVAKASECRWWPSSGRPSSIVNGGRHDSSCLQGVVKPQSSTPKNSSKPALVQGHGLGVVSAQTGAIMDKSGRRFVVRF